MRTTVATIGVALLLVAGCEKAEKPAAVVAAPPTTTFTLDTALSDRLWDFDNVKTSPGSGGKGIYILTPRGVWLLEGTEAWRVHEEPGASK